MPSKAIGNFVKNNAGSIGAAALFNAGDLTTPGNQLKGILGTLKDMAIWRIAAATGFAGLFVMLGAGIKGLVKDTGALEAALKKLAQMQALTQTFERISGSMKKARQEVKLFAEFARNKSLKFEVVAEAAKSLELLGRGLLGGVQNMNMLNDAAAGTGNTLTDTAEAAAQFTEALNSHNGLPQAIDNMEQMGLIAHKTADTLKEMSMHGGTRTGMLSVFKQDLLSHPGAADRQRSTVEGVKAREGAATNALKEAFGKGFAGDEVKNRETKATVKEALVPYAGMAGGFLKGLYQAVNPWSALTETGANWVAKLAPAPMERADTPDEIKALKAQQERTKAARFNQDAIERGLGIQAQRRALDVGEQHQLGVMMGDTGWAKRMENQQTVEDRFNQYVAAGYDRDYAARRAVSYARNQIQIEGNQAGVSLNAAAAVSELARIGGGGGVENVRGSTTDIAQQQLEVERDMKIILGEIKQLIKDPEGSGLL